MWPVVEYASCVWDPHTQWNITKVEAVQCQSARLVMNDFSQESSPSAMISALGWELFQHCRAISKVTMLYKISNDLICIPNDQLMPVETSTRGNTHQFQIPATRTNVLKWSYIHDTIRLWWTLCTGSHSCSQCGFVLDPCSQVPTRIVYYCLLYIVYICF